MFREKFKYYKRKVPLPDLADVLDFSKTNVDYSKVIRREPFELGLITGEILSEFGLAPVEEWNIYELTSCPGLVVIESPLTRQGQRLWIEKALQIFPRPPSRLNLHAHGEISPQEDWWHLCQTDEKRREALYKKLRWATLGYHHNWDTKVYSENNRSEFPEDLKVLCKLLAGVSCGVNFEPQAAIINYYHVGNTLSGHTDHSEPYQQAPLVSLSLGEEAIFMIGGESLEDNCDAMLVRSGDVIIMSGQSRRCYHGVPLIRKSLNSPWDLHNNEISPEWEPFRHYISDSRININVRQVLPPGILSLST